MHRILIPILALAFAASASAQTRVKFTLDWIFEGQTSFVWLAQQKGYFQQEGLEVQVDAGTGSAAAIQRIHTGAYDIGLGDVNAMIEYLGNFPGQQRMQMVYLLYDENPIAYYALRKSGARTIADLAGKTIVGRPFEVSVKLFPIFAKAARIDPKSVTFLNLDAQMRATAVIKGDAFAAGGFFTIPTEFEARGVKREDIVEMKVSDLGVRIYGNGLLVSNKLIAENPKAVAGFVRAFNRALREFLADPVPSAKALNVRDPLTNEAVELERIRSVMPAIVTARVRANGLGEVDKAVLANLVEEVSAVLPLKTKPNANDIFNPGFLPPKSERMLLK
jgi:NitT/TauT family transport system substrate-binding protein